MWKTIDNVCYNYNGDDMTNEEKYYRRAYKLLDDLSIAYKNGFDRKKTMEFWKNEFLQFIQNPILSVQKKDSLMLTIVISLMGLNKESIERKEKVEGFEELPLFKDFRELNLDNASISKIDEFEKSKTRRTVFDNWLSIINSPDNDISNQDIFRRVRNGLLHSNFDVDSDDFQTTYTHIKIKGYYESIIFNQNFYQYVISYFGNSKGVSLTDEDIFFDVIDVDITDIDTLKRYLKKMTIIKIENKIDNYDGSNTIGMRTLKNLSKNKRVISTNRFRKFFQNGFGEDIKVESIDNYYLADTTINAIIKRIEYNYRDFFKLTKEEKMSIINSNVSYTLNSKAEISNWLLHFYHLINSIPNKNFDVNCDEFLGDEYANISCSSAISILKAYLVLYRIQNIKNNNENSLKFNDIDYSLLTFDFGDEDFYIWSENVDGSSSIDYYEQSYNKQSNKNPEMTQEEIKKYVICDVIRNGLAHGNINSFFSEETGDTIIEIKDINPKNKNETRCLQMTIEKFNKFLDSEAFLPKYCYKKENEKSL